LESQNAIFWFLSLPLILFNMPAVSFVVPKEYNTLFFYSSIQLPQQLTCVSRGGGLGVAITIR
jgi:hypothetical protein